MGYGARKAAFAVFVALLVTGCIGSDRPEASPQKTPVVNTGDASNAGGITEEANRLILPGPPGTVVFESETSPQGEPVSFLTWSGTGDDTISGYNVYKQEKESDWALIGFAPLRKEDPRNRGRYQLRDQAIGEGIYAVSAVDRYGKPGPKSPGIKK